MKRQIRKVAGVIFSYSACLLGAEHHESKNVTLPHVAIEMNDNIRSSQFEYELSRYLNETRLSAVLSEKSADYIKKGIRSLEFFPSADQLSLAENFFWKLGLDYLTENELSVLTTLFANCNNLNWTHFYDFAYSVTDKNTFFKDAFIAYYSLPSNQVRHEVINFIKTNTVKNDILRPQFYIKNVSNIFNYLLNHETHVIDQNKKTAFLNFVDRQIPKESYLNNSTYLTAVCGLFYLYTNFHDEKDQDNAIHFVKKYLETTQQTDVTFDELMDGIFNLYYNDADKFKHFMKSHNETNASFAYDFDTFKKFESKNDWLEFVIFSKPFLNKFKDNQNNLADIYLSFNTDQERINFISSDFYKENIDVNINHIILTYKFLSNEDNKALFWEEYQQLYPAQTPAVKDMSFFIAVEMSKEIADYFNELQDKKVQEIFSSFFKNHMAKYPLMFDNVRIIISIFKKLEKPAKILSFINFLIQNVPDRNIKKFPQYFYPMSLIFDYFNTKKERDIFFKESTHFINEYGFKNNYADEINVLNYFFLNYKTFRDAHDIKNMKRYMDLHMDENSNTVFLLRDYLART